MMAGPASPISMNPAKFRLDFPAFADPLAVADETIIRHFSAACVHISPKPGKRLNGERRERALYLMTAHLMHLEREMLAGSAAAMVSGASVDKVSVSLAPPPVKSQREHWLCLSPYGQELLPLLKSRQAGGVFIGGMPAERAGFRRAGGGFLPGKGSNA